MESGESNEAKPEHMQVMLHALVKEGIGGRYVEVVKEAKCSTDITLFTNPVRIPTERSVKKRDYLSPKLFRACPEIVLGKMIWEGAVPVNGDKRLNHLWLADDALLIAHRDHEIKPKIPLEEIPGGANSTAPLMSSECHAKTPHRPLQHCRVKSVNIWKRNVATDEGSGENVGSDGQSNERRMHEVSLHNHSDIQTFCRMSGVRDTVMATTERKIRWDRYVSCLAEKR